MKNNLINQKFGSLLVVEKAKQHGPGRVAVWRCLCDCGKEAFKIKAALIKPKIVSCGCRIQERFILTGAGRRDPSPTMSSYRKLYGEYKSRTTKRFSLKLEQFISLISKNCFYCDAPPSKTKNANLTKSGKYRTSNKQRIDQATIYYNGLDKINPKKGYTINNVLPACWICNRAKSDTSYERFLLYLKQVSKSWCQKEHKK